MSTYMTGTVVEEGAPRVRFAARERRGVFLGLSWGQLMMIALVVAIVLTAIFLHLPKMVFVVVVVVSAMIFTFGVATWHGEPVLLIAWQVLRYTRRSMAGQTQFRRDVWSRVATASLAVGRSRQDTTAPFATSRYLLPGALGDVQIVQVPDGGAIAYNAKGRLASITFQLGSRAWALRDSSTQEAAYDGFVEWLSSLEHVPGLKESTIRIRVDKASSNQLNDYMAARHELMMAAHGDPANPPVSQELIRDYWDLIRAGEQRSMAFSNYLTLTFSIDELGSAIRDAGKGLLGLGRILSERAASAITSMQRVRLENAAWLDAQQLQALLSTASDPVSASTRRERESIARHIAALNPPIMGIDEQWDAVRVDESWHQTFWVAEWPRTEVRTGFLEPLLYGGEATRVIALQVQPVPIHKALGEVSRAQTDMESAANLRMRMSARISLSQEREAKALDERERDLVDGFGDVRFRGFVTVSADTKDALARARSEIEQASHEARVTLVSMFGQQAAAFATTTLPLPAEGK